MLAGRPKAIEIWGTKIWGNMNTKAHWTFPLRVFLCGVWRTYIHPHPFHRLVKNVILCLIHFLFFQDRSPVFFLFLSPPYALHRMEMNCPSVGWIYSFIHNSGSVVQCRARKRTSGLEGLSLELWPPMWSRKTGAASGPQNARCERSFSQLSVETEGVGTEALRCRLGKRCRLKDTSTTAPPETDIRKRLRSLVPCVDQ